MPSEQYVRYVMATSYIMRDDHDVSILICQHAELVCS